MQLATCLAFDAFWGTTFAATFAVGHRFLDSPEKEISFSSWLFLKVPILRRRAELEAQGYNHRSGTLQVAHTHVKRA